MSSSKPKLVPVKPIIKKLASDLTHCVTSTSRAFVQQPLHTKSPHVTASILVNNRFEVLATHRDTSDAVLDDTILYKALHQQYRVGKQQTLASTGLDINISMSDLACKVLPTELQVCTNTTSLNLFYLLFYVAFNSQSHIAMGGFTGRGNQCILHCKSPGIGK